MIDIEIIRENPSRVQENAKNKGVELDTEQIVALDETHRDVLHQVENLRAQRNEHVSSFTGKPSKEQIVKGRELKDKIGELENELTTIENKLTTLLKQVPNVALDDVPVGQSEDDNQVFETVGQQPAFDFEPKSHADIGELHDWIDKERAAKVSGSRFAYIKGELAQLQLAIINWTVAQLTDQSIITSIIEHSELNVATTPFTFVFPPAMVRTEVFDAMDRLEPRDDRYRVGADDDQLWLQGSAEHTIGPMHIAEIVNKTDLPMRYVGYSSSFRREAGSYGKDTEGIFRMHQFDKLEMESFSTADSGQAEHSLMIAIQRYLVEQLELPYQLIQKCTADIGKPNASGWDINVWFPSQSQYRETHTADYMTDFQARRLNTRYRAEGDSPQFVHNNDATAFALGRTMAAILENFQNADGSVAIPKVLQPYMNKKEVIGES